MSSNCIFCKIAAGEIPSEALYEDERVYAFRDIDPQAPQHVLIIPRRHVETLLDLNADDNELVVLWDQGRHPMPKASKAALAIDLVEVIAQRYATTTT